jgi:hypothetical protein
MRNPKRRIDLIVIFFYNTIFTSWLIAFMRAKREFQAMIELLN